MLILRLPRGRVGIEPEPSQRVVEEGASDLDLGFAAPHAVVDSDDLRLRFRELGVGPTNRVTWECQSPSSSTEVSLSRYPRVSMVRESRKSLKLWSARQKARVFQRNPSNLMACGAFQRQ